MVTISNNGFISLTRGDSFSVPLFINMGTGMAPVRYSLLEHPETEIYLGVMEPNQPFEKALIRKKYTHESRINENGDLMIDFTGTDTEYLVPGKYFYQIKAKFIDKETGINVDTIVSKKQFIVRDWGI